MTFDPNLLREVTFLDIEASALDGGYPIEIGWATVDIPGQTLREVESFLICPTPAWLGCADGWSEVSARIHGITQGELLRDGMSAEEAMDRLDSAFAGRVVFSDSPKDQEWLLRLYRGGASHERSLPFTRKDVATVFERHDTDEMRIHVAQKMRSSRTRTHRAAEDAREWAELFLHSRR